MDEKFFKFNKLIGKIEDKAENLDEAILMLNRCWEIESVIPKLKQLVHNLTQDTFNKYKRKDTDPDMVKTIKYI